MRPDSKYAKIVRSIIEAIRSEEIVPFDLLPPQRVFAEKLGVNLSTVTRAYSELQKLGIIAGEVGRGTYVLPRNNASELFALGQPLDCEQIDLRTAVAPLPTKAISQQIAHLYSKSVEQVFYKPLDENDIFELKQAWASLLERRYVKLDTRNIFLTSSCHSAIHNVLTILCSRGDSILVEELTYPGLRSILSGIGLKSIPVSLDEHGIIPSDLDRKCLTSSAKVLFCQPNIHNPTGAVSGHARRTELGQIIERNNLTVVEDDVYGCYQDNRPLIDYLEGEHYIVGGLSKLVSAGLRLGYIGCTRNFEATGKAPSPENSSWHVSLLSSNLFTEIVKSNLIDTFIENGKKRINDANEIASKYFPTHVQKNVPFLWVRAPQDFQKTAMERSEIKIALLDQSYFRIGGRDTPVTTDFVRISLLNHTSLSQLDIALKSLKQIIQ